MRKRISTKLAVERFKKQLEMDRTSWALLLGMCAKCLIYAAEPGLIHCEICLREMRIRAMEAKWRRWGIAA